MTCGICSAAPRRSASSPPPRCALVPAAAARCTAWIGLASPDDALRLLRRLDAALGRTLEALNSSPTPACKRCCAIYRRPAHRDLDPWYALVELAGDDGDALTEALESSLANALGDGLIRDVAIARAASLSNFLAPARFDLGGRARRRPRPPT